MLGLYLHIPFCSSICNYCNFFRGLFEAGLKSRYVDALDGVTPKPEKHPTPPDHRVYPRGNAQPPAPKPTPEKRTAWTRAVPPDRAFPRS